MFNYKISEYFERRNYIITSEEMYHVQQDSVQVSYELLDLNAFQDEDHNWYSSYKFSTNENFMCDENKEWIVYMRNYIN